MRSLDEIIASTPDGGKSFNEDCVAVFRSGAGRRVIEALVKAVPLNHAPIADSALAQHTHGRAEVVMALWRRSQPAIQPSDLPTT